MLVDIFSLNELETDTVRLNASTIKQLFEDTNYTLEDVRKKKLVKPVALTLLLTIVGGLVTAYIFRWRVLFPVPTAEQIYRSTIV